MIDTRQQYETYTRLLARHRKTIWAVCWNRAGGNEERFRDLVQEVSMRLWLRLDGLRPEASPQAERIWVELTARSVLHDLTRKKQTETVPLGEEHLDTLAAPPQEQSWLKEELLRCVDPGDRPMLSLRMEGYRNDDIAVRLGMSPRTVRRRMKRLLRQLERYVAEYMK